MKPADTYFTKQSEAVREIFLALREIILSQDKAVTLEWKYRMPIFCYKGKMFCYLWTRQKTGEPYIGFVEGKHFDHPLLLQENRSRMKILIIDPNKDLPLEVIVPLLGQAIELYRKGVVIVK